MRSLVCALVFGFATGLHLVTALPANASPVSGEISLVSRDGIIPSTDFSWIRNWAALGDSYAAGIGVGKLHSDADAASCSRYDESYPDQMDLYFGDPPSGSSRSFQHYACSGDTSQMIKNNQVPRLKDGSQDFITLSAGGNDVGFSDVLKTCIFLPTPQSACDAALQKANDTINNELENNIIDLLKAVLPKVSSTGFLVYTLYGQFFSEKPGPCDTQSWCFFNPTTSGCLLVTVDLRKKFNLLVGAANAKVASAIATANKDQPKSIRAANWTTLPRGVHGLFCEPDSADRSNDPTNALLAYIRDDTGNHFVPPDKQILSDVQNQTVSSNVSVRSIDTFQDDQVTKRHQLVKRIPDSVAKLFHPTAFGHSIIASAAISEVSGAEAKLLKIPDGMGQCQIRALGPQCNGPAFQKWAGRDALADAVSQFCGDYKNFIPNRGSKSSLDFFPSYDDAVTLSIDWTTNMLLSKNLCHDTFMTIVDSCDGKVAPGWHKFGGKVTVEKFGTFTVSPKINGDHLHLGCKVPSGSGAYVNPDTLRSNTQQFCKALAGTQIKPKDIQKTPYSKDTYDSVDISIQWLLPASSDATTGVSEADCNSYFSRLIDSCPGEDPNPMNWKYGGSYTVDEIQISIDVTGRATGRTHPPPGAPIAKCDSFYQFIRDEFWIYGAGWSDSDAGDPLLRNMTNCIGSTPTDWTFTYYDQPDQDGYEWLAFGHTPIWQKNCFTPVIQGAGGPNIPCNGAG